MIKDIKSTKLKINVFLRDGHQYLGCDIPSNPMGNKERFVSFWNGESIYLIPLDLVERIEMYEED